MGQRLCREDVCGMGQRLWHGARKLGAEMMGPADQFSEKLHEHKARQGGQQP